MQGNDLVCRHLPNFEDNFRKDTLLLWGLGEPLVLQVTGLKSSNTTTNHTIYIEPEYFGMHHIPKSPV